MTKQKSLGQIAYEAKLHGIRLTHFLWKQVSPADQAIYEAIANSVAREVKRRLRKQGK